MANTITKSELIQRIIDGHPGEIARKEELSRALLNFAKASAAVNDVKRPSRFEQQRDCLFPFRSE